MGVRRSPNVKFFFFPEMARFHVETSKDENNVVVETTTSLMLKQQLLDVDTRLMLRSLFQHVFAR